MVGMEERIRVSSVMVFPSRGTLTSQRTSTFFPLSSSSARSEMDFLASSSVGAEKLRTPKDSVRKKNLKKCKHIGHCFVIGKNSPEHLCSSFFMTITHGKEQKQQRWKQQEQEEQQRKPSFLFVICNKLKNMRRMQQQRYQSKKLM